MPLSIAVIVGSLRRESFNRRLAQAVVRLEEARGHAFRFLEIDELPLYNQDDDGRHPEAAMRFKDAVRAADGVMFVSPGYNGSIPGVLKNAIDYGSRPYAESAWRGKPAGMIGVSAGAHGAAAAQAHLGPVLTLLQMQLLDSPEVALKYADEMFDEDGELAGPARELCAEWLHAFLAHVEAHRAAG